MVLSLLLCVAVYVSLVFDTCAVLPVAMVLHVASRIELEAVSLRPCAIACSNRLCSCRPVRYSWSV